ncbi:hypothetical protein [Chitinophaga rhizophila]|uniref:Uncharacterized protein n=1 Tax=Chitinophaga rhizophila TaxID=2866212 RepID=A0ABS7GD85_9BACT|nr:hypothetical protein [Chitinophaga rhizophila]MBW8685386.1 hypothetical protein [Chitinophaga rhizophila]
MKKIIATIVCTLCTFVICAQLVWLSVDKQPFAGTYSRNYHQLFTTWQNQAALAYLPAPAAGVSTERRFMLAAISTHRGAVAIPVTNGGFGLQLAQSGFPDFRRQSLGLAYGRKLGERLSMGLQMNYISQMIPGYFKVHAFVAEWGCLFHLTRQLHAGLHVFNPAGMRLKSLSDEQVPVIYSAGIGYEISPVFLLSAAVVKETAADLLTKVMCEYRIIPALSLQLGICTVPQLNTAALGLTVGQLYFLLTASHHPQLGVTPSGTVVWHLKKHSL